jgi:hypothetical protein
MSDDDAPDLFALYREDKFIVDKLIEIVNVTIGRPDATPEHIYHAGKLLLALIRLPRPTPGMHIVLSVGERTPNGESSHFILELSGERFGLETSEYVIFDPSVGGDAIGNTCFESEVGGYRDSCDRDVLADYLAAFKSRMLDDTQTVSIEDIEDASNLDWSIDFDEDEYWRMLDSEYY